MTGWKAAQFKRWWRKHDQARKARLRRLRMGLPTLHPYPGQERVWNRIKGS